MVVATAMCVSDGDGCVEVLTVSQKASLHPPVVLVTKGGQGRRLLRGSDIPNGFNSRQYKPCTPYLAQHLLVVESGQPGMLPGLS